MTYFSQECIFDMIAAQGPQDFHDLCRECYTQATDCESQEQVSSAISDLIEAGLIAEDWIDDSENGTFYVDLSDFGCELSEDQSKRQREYEEYKREQFGI
jgi:hypothetical protein